MTPQRAAVMLQDGSLYVGTLVQAEVTAVPINNASPGNFLPGPVTIRLAIEDAAEMLPAYRAADGSHDGGCE